jgi:hypothetical protein
MRDPLKAICLMLSFACLLGCKKNVPMATIPPSPAQAVVPVRHDEKLPEPPAPQTSPADVVQQPAIPSQPVATIPPPPEPPPAKKKRPKRKPAQPAPPPKAEEPAGPPAPEPAPKLGQLLSSEQEQSYNRAIDRDLQRAKSNLVLAEGKTLSDPQKVVVQQVRSFIKQTEDLRKSDLEAAQGLSHKADILASDLARSLQ